MGERANKHILCFKGANGHMAGQLVHPFRNYSNIDSS